MPAKNDRTLCTGSRRWLLGTAGAMICRSPQLELVNREHSSHGSEKVGVAILWASPLFLMPLKQPDLSDRSAMQERMVARGMKTCWLVICTTESHQWSFCSTLNERQKDRDLPCVCMQKRKKSQVMRSCGGTLRRSWTIWPDRLLG